MGVVSPFLREVKTVSGAMAVQIAVKEGRRDKVIEHLGSAHTEAELAALMEIGRHRIAPDQLALDLTPTPPAVSGLLTASAPVGTDAVVESKRSGLLWEVLHGVYTRLGLRNATEGDRAFEQMVLARLIEPTSKAQVPRVLGDLGVEPVSVRTLFRSLGRCGQRGYRESLSGALFEHVTATRGLALCLYDVTTLYFEAEHEDHLRKVGYSKERRVDPQIIAGLLVDRRGFPLRIGCWEGNKAETTTIIPIAEAFQAAHGIFHWHGDAFTDGQVIDTITPRRGSQSERDKSRKSEPVWDPHTHPGSWRAVWAYSKKRAARDNQTLTAQANHARAVIAGEKHPKGTRFVTIHQGDQVLDEASIARARSLVGLKGYVTNIPSRLMGAGEVVSSYHELWHVEQSFRMSKHDLRARPVFHHTRNAIEAHLTVVMAALAVARYLQEATGISIARIVRELRGLQEVTINLNGHHLAAAPRLTDTADDILTALSTPPPAH